MDEEDGHILDKREKRKKTFGDDFTTFSEGWFT